MPTGRLELILARNLLTNISIPAFLADNRGGLVFYNEAAESLLGMPFPQARNMDPEEWRARFRSLRQRAKRIPFEKEPLTIALREGRPVHRHRSTSAAPTARVHPSRSARFRSP